MIKPKIREFNQLFANGSFQKRKGYILETSKVENTPFILK